MASRKIRGAGFSPDILAFLDLLSQRRVRYVIVGGEAVIFHGYPRVTGDVHFFYESSAANLRRLFQVLLDFWEGDIPGVRSLEELGEPGLVLQFGRPPHRIDLMNRIDGVGFSSAWRSRITVALETSTGLHRAHYISAGALLKNKKAVGRPKDLDDARFLSARYSLSGA